MSLNQVYFIRQRRENKHQKLQRVIISHLKGLRTCYNDLTASKSTMTSRQTWAQVQLCVNNHAFQRGCAGAGSLIYTPDMCKQEVTSWSHHDKATLSQSWTQLCIFSVKASSIFAWFTIFLCTGTTRFFLSGFSLHFSGPEIGSIHSLGREQSFSFKRASPKVQNISIQRVWFVLVGFLVNIFALKGGTQFYIVALY